ncbi:MAG: hypothetical protein H7231_07095 [Rhodoferax sp.]|nr:hypothetical protein [Actinomycetota bacterium]
MSGATPDTRRIIPGEKRADAVRSGRLGVWHQHEAPNPLSTGDLLAGDGCMTTLSSVVSVLVTAVNVYLVGPSDQRGRHVCSSFLPVTMLSVLGLVALQLSLPVLIGALNAVGPSRLPGALGGGRHGARRSCSGPPRRCSSWMGRPPSSRR